MSLEDILEQPVPLQIEALMQGFPGNSLKELSKLLGLPQKVLVGALHFSPRTVALRQKKNGVFTTSESERLLRVVRIQKLAREIFGKDEAVAEWMTEPDGALGGKPPLEMLTTDLGFNRVENLVKGMIHGVPV